MSLNTLNILVQHWELDKNDRNYTEFEYIKYIGSTGKWVLSNELLYTV